MGVSKKGGLIGGFDQLKAPNAPTISVTPGNQQVSVAFTNPSDVGGGAITSYTATAIASGVSTGVTSSSSPVVITGLTNGTSYSVTGLANNAFGASPYSEASSSSPASSRALFAGGGTIASFDNLRSIDYIDITSTGNASDFGDLNQPVSNGGATASTTRGLFIGGSSWNESTNGNQVSYVTISSLGDSQDFGDLISGSRHGGACGSSTRALYSNGAYGVGVGGALSPIDYFTIASTGNGTDFGDNTQASSGKTAFSSPTRGVFSCGYTTGYTNVMDYVTIASTGNATDFGDNTQTRYLVAGCSSNTRGLTSGGDASGSASNTIDYVTIASTGNATDFGDLTATKTGHRGTSNSTRGVFAGGYSSGNLDVIEYITIGSTGNATDFGDLTVARQAGPSGLCGSHGGL
tara:strand:- start:1852 stop:3069 length:1218 start_codon:yes stop_codon:yes gene_type:complete